MLIATKFLPFSRVPPSTNSPDSPYKLTCVIFHFLFSTSYLYSENPFQPSSRKLMTNLFSIFDPSALLGLPLNWLALLYACRILPLLYWVSPNQIFQSFKSLVNFVYSEFYAIFQPINMPGMLIKRVSLFLLIVLNNTLGLIPYIFTRTRHLTATVRLALPLWLGHILYARRKTPNSILAHLLPLGTPLALMPFIVIIEITRNLIRPLTLSVRLAANIVAGHLLLTLLSAQAPHLPTTILSLLIVALLSLVVLESAVAVIQAYVFSVLSSLYLNEVNRSTLIPQSPPLNYS